MGNIKRCTKKILSIILLLSIIINLIPNFHLIYASSNSEFGKIILQKGNYDETNKIFALELCIRDMNFIAVDLTFTYPSELMEIIKYENYEDNGNVKTATTAMQAIKSNDIITGATVDSMSGIDSESGKVHTLISVCSPGGSFSPYNMTDSQEVIGTIYFHITDESLIIEDIETSMFNLDNDSYFAVVNGEEEESSDINMFSVEGFKGPALPIVSSISVDIDPTQGKEYILGDQIDLTDGTLTVNYIDGTTKSINMTDADLMIKTGNKQGSYADLNNPITFEYQGKTTELNINIVDTVETIEFFDKDKILEKTQFSDGDVIPRNSLYIKAKLKSEKEEIIALNDSRIQLDCYEASQDKILDNEYHFEEAGIIYGIQQIGITYTDSYVTKTTMFNIIVNDKVGEINILNSKEEYIINEEFEKNGEIEVIGKNTKKNYGTISMSSGSVTVTEIDGSKVDLSKVGEKELLVSFGGVTNTYPINVQNEVQSIRVNVPNDVLLLDYNKESKTAEITQNDLTGVTVTEIMGDGTEGNTVDLDLSWIDKTNFNGTKTEKQTLKVNYPYNGKTLEGTLDVKVKDKLIGITIDNFVTEYEYKDELDYTGAKFSIEYVNGVYGPYEFEEGDLEVLGFDNTQMGDQELTFSYNDGEYTESAKLIVNIRKTNPEYSIPTDLEGYEGNELSEIDLTLYPGFSWVDPTEKLTLGTNNKYKTTMTYTPDDTEHYNIVENIEVEVSVIPVEVESIEITKEPDDIEYIEGQTFDPTGMKITVTYNTGKTVAIDSNYEEKGVIFSPKLTDALTTDNTQVTVTYSGKSATQHITVEAKKVTSIAVTKGPDKTSYVEGQNLNLTGMVVTATYNDGDKQPTTNYTTSPANGATLNTVGTQTIEVTYTGADAVAGIATASTSVEVEAKKVTSIAVTTAPTKANYIAGQALNLDGMVVTATYNDGDKQPTTDYTTSPANGATLNTVGTQTIEVTYTGADAVAGIATASTSVTVEKKVVERIAVTTPPTKISYVEGHPFEAAGMVVTAYYNDGTDAPITDYTISPLGDLTPANTQITITYNGTDIAEGASAPTANVTITVIERQVESIEITKEPKVNYIEGQNFDPTGMEITVNYNDGDTATISSDYSTKGVTFTPSTNLQTANDKVVVSYRGFTDNQLITVIPDSVTDITITAPKKLEYNYGDTIDLSGATIKKVWASGLKHENDEIPMTKDMLSNADIASFDNMNSLGQKQITVKYNGIIKENAFQITVKDYISSIRIEDKSKLQTEYEYGDTINITDKDTGAKLYIIVEYAGGTPNERVELTSSMVSGFNMNTVKNGQTVTVKYEGKTDTYTINVKDKVTGIDITKEPAKKIYKLGETTQFTGIVVKNIMASGAQGTMLTASEYTISAVDTNTVGEKTVTVTKNGTDFKDTFKIKVIDATEAINITKMPKTSYKYGDVLDITGGEITITTQILTKVIPMTDASVKVTGYNPNKLGEQTLTVAYTYSEETDNGIETKTLTDIYTVTVEDYWTGKIKLTPPTKTSYEYGMPLDLTGATVSKIWASGKTTDKINIDGAMVSGYNATTVGTQTIKVNAFGKENVGSFNVTVEDKVKGISMNNLPNKTEYTQGEAIDVSGAVLNVTKSSGIKEIAITKEMISGYDPNKVGTQVITVTYNGFTTEFVVVVKAKTVEKPTTPVKPNKPVTPPTPTTPVTPSNPPTPSTSEVVKYTVTFVDYDGTVLKTEEVERGKSATAPKVDERTSYRFTGWDSEFDAVEEDITVMAKYEKIEATTKPSEKPSQVLGEKDEAKEENNVKDTLVPATIGLGITGLLLLLISALTKKNVEIYAVTEEGKKLIGREKISKNNITIMLNAYKDKLEDASAIEIKIAEKTVEKLGNETIKVVINKQTRKYKVKDTIVIKNKNIR